MWLCLSDAFLSVVHKQCGPDELLVRARVAGHIQKVFPDAVVTESVGTDYRYRAVMPRQRVADMLIVQAMTMDYDNFKNTVREDRLHSAYNRVWGVMGDLQPGGPYSRRSRSAGAMRDLY